MPASLYWQWEWGGPHKSVEWKCNVNDKNAFGLGDHVNIKSATREIPLYLSVPIGFWVANKFIHFEPVLLGVSFAFLFCECLPGKLKFLRCKFIRILRVDPCYLG